MKISVITVCFNSADRLERTIKSVVSQDFGDFEYIVVDGASKDGTSSIIEKYSGSISKWVSEPDSGIYDAMNKGARMASGDFCIFMNAGDRFVNPGVLSRVAPLLDEDCSIVTGNQISVDAEGRFFKYYKHWSSVSAQRLYDDSLCHQASFINRKDLLDFPYDESLRMVSDWKEAIVLLVVEGKKYKGIDVDVDIFYRDGVTYSATDLKHKENEAVIDQYYSPDRKDAFAKALVDYKKWWNVERYVNFVIRGLSQSFYRLKYRSILSR